MGTLVAPKSGFYVSSFNPFYSESLNSTPTLVVSSVDIGRAQRSVSSWKTYDPNESEVMMYLGRSSFQVQLTGFDPPSPNDNHTIKYHEVLWRGVVHRVKSGTFQRLKRIPGTSLRKKVRGKKYDKKSASKGVPKANRVIIMPSVGDTIPAQPNKGENEK